jgi:amino acid permease
MGAEKGPRDLESSVDMDDKSEVGRMEEIKRNLKSRHINMIAIAGMIVSSNAPKN